MSSTLQRNSIPTSLVNSPLPPVPAPRGPRSNTEDSSSSDGLPPQYVPATPLPIMCGYLEKTVGDPSNKNNYWSRKYVEVADGFLRFYNAQTEREQCAVEVELTGSFVYTIERRQICIESKGGVRLFRASSDVRALKWMHIISRYCSVAPTAESYCQKLSGRNVMQERYLRLSADGIISWYRDEKESAECKGAILVRGESVEVYPDDQRIIKIFTTDRTYQFQFSTAQEANLWYAACLWHSNRAPPVHTSMRVRNTH